MSEPGVWSRIRSFFGFAPKPPPVPIAEMEMTGVEGPPPAPFSFYEFYGDDVRLALDDRTPSLIFRVVGVDGRWQEHFHPGMRLEMKGGGDTYIIASPTNLPWFVLWWDGERWTFGDYR